MLTETIQLETLRQSIEDSEFKSGDRSDYLDRGKPNPAEAKQAQELIVKLNNQSKVLKEELKQLIATVRSKQPQALEEWINFHVEILQKVAEEKATDASAAARRNVAKETIQNWEKVRAGELEYVNINWYFLKDYKATVRTITGGSTKKVNSASQEKAQSKAWWQIWK